MLLFIKLGIQEYEEWNMGNARNIGNAITILGNLLEDPENVIMLSFRGMFKKIPGNFTKNSKECSR